MKKIFISLLFVLPLLFSCQPQIDPYQPGEEEVAGCYGVYFPSQEATGSHTLDPTMAPEATFTAMRKNTKGAITVPLTVKTSADGVFNVGQLNFADGQSESTFTVTFPNSEIGTQYNLSVAIDDPQYASKYQDQPIAFDYSFMRVEWKEFGHATFYEGWWSEVHTANIKYYEVNGVRTCVAECDEGNGIWGDSVNATIQFTWYTKNYNSDGYQLIAIPKQYFGFDYNDWGSKPEADAVYPVYLYDYYTYWIERGESLGTFLEFAAKYGDLDGSYPVSYYDGNGGFMFNARYYIPGLGGFSPDPFELQGIVDGFNRADYSLDLSAGDMSEGIMPITFDFTTDLTEVKYAAFEGSLTPTQIENRAASINDGSVESTSIEYAGTAYVTLPASGHYTLVAVGYANGAMKSTGSVEFNYVTLEDEDEYAVVIFGGTEKTSALYVKDNYTDENSFQFYLYGEDLTGVKLGVFKTADVEAAGGPVSMVGKLKAVSADNLALINGKGYTDIATGLDANTEYSLVVWSTNSYLTRVDEFTYTTAGLPLELVGTGTYTYAQFFQGDDEGLELFYNPNIENQFELPNWGGGVTLKFTWNRETNEVQVLPQPIGYTYGSYGDVYVADICAVIDEEAEPSYFDPEHGTFMFNVIYFVSAGTFGEGGLETFVFDGANEPEPDPDPEPGTDALLSGLTLTHHNINVAIHQPTLAGIAVEREGKAVPVTVNSVEKKVNTVSNRELVKD